MKKIVIIIFIFSFLLIHFSAPAQASVNIWPGKLEITMSGGYPKEPITYNISVNNPDTYSVNASTRIDDLFVADLRQGYTNIPNRSWITVTPEKLYLPPKSTRDFKISVDIPENEKLSQYNKSWETLVVISPQGGPTGAGGGAAIQIELGVKIFINTPQGNNKLTAVQSFYFILIFLVPIVVTCVAIFYSKKRHVNKNNKL